MKPLSQPDFETWMAISFDPPASDDSFGDWYWTILEDPLATEPPLAAEHLLRLLDAPGALLEMHHDNQVASGLSYIFDPGCGGDAQLLGEASVPQADRLGIAARIDRVYSQLVVPRCPEVLGHKSEDGGRLAAVAYMFWDVCTLGVPARDSDRTEYFDALIDAMGRILALPHAGAQEGALHGLGHWGRFNEDKARGIIDRWLDEASPARSELLPYARAARTGCIL